MTVYTEETFGPVVSIYPFADEEQAVALANATEYGLGASIWSRDVAHARALATRVKAGQININESFASVHISNDTPQGGRSPPASAAATASTACCRSARCSPSRASTASAST